MSDPLFPALFVGHGNPMNAIEDNPFSRAWAEQGRLLPRPQAIVCISAHWQTRGVAVTAMEQPPTIYDFYGFPPELYQQKYLAPGSPALARQVQEMLASEPINSPPPVQLDLKWGLDHGAWSVLLRLFPQADIPVVQLSLDLAKSPAEHYALAKALRPLRQQGVLILGSGNLVHNLRLACWEEKAYDWALEFDALLAERIRAGDHAAPIDYPNLSAVAHSRAAIPTNEHYLPLLYILAQQEPGEKLAFFAEQVTMCSISMRGLRIG